MKKSAQALRLNTLYFLIQAAFWMGYAAIQGFSSVYLLDAGFSNTQIGMLIAIASVVSVALQPTVAAYADRAGSLSVKSILMIVDGVMLGAAVMIFLTRGILWATAASFGLGIALLMLLSPLVNALGTETINLGKPLNFGLGRGGGSIGYALASYVLGRLEASFGTVLVPICTFIMFAGLMVIVLIFPFEKAAKEPLPAQRQKGGILAFFRAYPTFTLVLLGCTLLYTGYSMMGSFTFQVVQSKGGDSPQLGAVMALSACVELPTLFFFASLRHKARAEVWLIIAGIFMTCKNLGSLLVPNMGLLYGVRTFQMLGYALIAVASVYYANAKMAPGDAVKGQALLTTSYTVGKVISNLCGGAIIDLAGIHAMMATAVATGIIGTLLFFFALEKRRS